MDSDALKRIERERDAAVEAIVSSEAKKKLVVAGPGTGKTFTFRRVLETCEERGLALTFIRNLVADLRGDLSDIADVFTFHGFCKHLMHRHPVAGLREGWDYYPPLRELVLADFKLLGMPSLTGIGFDGHFHALDDETKVITEGLRIGNYYNAVAHTDLVYRVLRHFEEHDDAIPQYPLVVVDEYQDFSLLETSFLDLLARKSPILVAGDDDQALYSFKRASPSFIRQISRGSDYVDFPLPYCSRCTRVIVDAVNATIKAAIHQGGLSNRIDKPFQCYVPTKLADSEAHPTIIHARCTVERKDARYGGRYVAEQIAQIPLDDIKESKEDGYPTVLVAGPNPFLESAYNIVQDRFPHAELKKGDPVEIDPLDGYRLLAKDAESRHGWRIIIHCYPFDASDEVLHKVLTAGGELAECVPDHYRERHLEVARVVAKLVVGEEANSKESTTVVDALGRSLAEIEDALRSRADHDEPSDEDDGDVPEDEPSIVCTTLVGAKGLSAGYVFIVGFTNGHLPRYPNAATDDEICCFLVGLSRTRKECHVISTGSLGGSPRSPSIFADWLKPYLEERTVNAAYFKQ